MAVGLDLAARQQLPQVVGMTIPRWQVGPRLFLLLVVVDRGEHHQAVQTDLVLAEQGHQLGRHRCQLHAALDHQRRDAEGGSHVLDRLALPDQLGEGGELVCGMHRDMEAVLGETGDQRLVGGDDQHRDRVVVGDVVPAHEQGQRFEATATGADFVAAACAFHDHKVLQHSAFLDRGREFGDAQLRRAAAGARLIVLREDQLVEGNEGTGRRRDDGVDFGFGEFHEAS